MTVFDPPRPAGSRIGPHHDIDPLTRRCMWCGAPRYAFVEFPQMAEFCSGGSVPIDKQLEGLRTDQTCSG